MNIKFNRKFEPDEELINIIISAQEKSILNNNIIDLHFANFTDKITKPMYNTKVLVILELKKRYPKYSYLLKKVKKIFIYFDSDLIQFRTH